MSITQDSGPAAGSAWPPPDAEPVDPEALYGRLADRGLRYGPAFRGVRRAWRDGARMSAEVALDAGVPTGDFLLHPALLDSALHAAVVPFLDGDDESAQLPFAWRGVRVHGPAGRAVRVRITPGDDRTIGLELTDGEGRPVATVDSLVVRSVSPEQLGARGGRLLRTVWRPVPPATGRPAPQGWALLGADHLGLTGSPAADRALAAVHPTLRSLVVALRERRVPETVLVCVDGSAPLANALQRALSLLQEWLFDERLADCRLVFVTRGGVAVRPGEVPEPAAAAVWGLVRSAQLEHPGRFALVDLDADAPWRAVEAAAGSDAAQLAVRQGALLHPRLAAAAKAARPGWDPRRSVLITGGTGSLGRLVARHLAERHGVRHLVLLSRRGPDAPGARELVDELAGFGTEAKVVACDAGDLAALRAVVAALPPEHPLGAVVHSAGVTSDATVGSLTPRLLDTVLAAKVDSALALHRLTEDVPDCALVLFSSVAGVLGSAGQGNYAAANAALDALAHRRRAAGLPGVSLAWGLWADEGGMASGLAAADLARMARSGLAALSVEQGLALLDDALTAEDPVLVPLRLHEDALRSPDAPLPELLLDLAAPRTRATAPVADADAFRARLAGRPEDERAQEVLELVRAQVAVVLGFTGGEEVEPHREFSAIGFDSLTNLELIRRLTAATGVRLPNTLAFDHPTPVELANSMTKLLG
ncbi:SDR family NAD(P)-dependent oxidoreductase [Kitasatospora sp. Ki12]